MGNCGCSREKIESSSEIAKEKLKRAGEYTKDKYQLAKTQASIKYDEAKEVYGPSVKEQYEIAKMKMQQYKPEKIEDNTQTQMITKFEESLPLKRMTIDEFERRLKKLVNPNCQNKINSAQLIESFKDFYPDIVEENSLIRNLLMNEAF